MKQWAYGKEARKTRYCIECGLRLKKWEVLMCGPCFEDLVYSTLPENTEQLERSGPREDEGEEVDDESD